MMQHELSNDIKELRAKIRETGLSYRQVYTAVGLSGGWFARTMQGHFIEPNPEWIAKIDGFLIDFLELTRSYQKK